VDGIFFFSLAFYIISRITQHFFGVPCVLYSALHRNHTLINLVNINYALQPKPQYI